MAPARCVDVRITATCTGELERPGVRARLAMLISRLYPAIMRISSGRDRVTALAATTEAYMNRVEAGTERVTARPIGGSGVATAVPR